MRRVAAALVLASVALLAAAAPASAHGGTGRQTTNHRAELLGLEPDVDGVRVRLVDDGTRIELAAGDHAVVVLGYEGEPYLRVDERGVFENRRSPSTYLNRSLNGDAPPAEADADAPPAWERIDDGTTVRWHDHALHVPAGQRAGARDVSRWERPIEIDGEQVALRGRIVTLDPPSMLPWLALAAVVGVAVVVLGRRAWPVALLVLVVADAGRVYGLVFGGPTWLVSRAQVAIDASVLSIVGWGMAAAAVVLLRQRRMMEAAASAAVSGGVLAVAGGVLELSDLRAARIGSALPDGAARVVVALVLGVGLGMVVSALLELRRGSSTPGWRARRSGSGPSPGDGTRTGSPARPPSG